MERIINVGGRMHSILTGNKTVITADVFDERLDEKQNVINLETPGFVVEPPSESLFDNSAGYVAYVQQVLPGTEAQKNEAKRIARANIGAISATELDAAIATVINAGGSGDIVLPINHDWTGTGTNAIDTTNVDTRFTALEPIVQGLNTQGVVSLLWFDSERNRLAWNTKTNFRYSNSNITADAQLETFSFDNFATKTEVNSKVSNVSYDGGEFTISKSGQPDVKISASKIVSDGGGGGSIDTSNLATKTELNDHAGNTSVHVTAQEKEFWNNKQSAISDYETTKTRANAAYDFIQGGIQISELSNEVQQSLSKANSSLLPGALTDYATTDILNQSLSGKQAILNGTNGDSGQNIKSINGNSILGTGNLKLVPYDDNGDVTITGTLTLSSLQPQNGVLTAEGGEVFSDSSIYMKYKGSVQDYETLPGSNGVLIGDTYFVEELNSLVTATSVTQDTNLYVRYPNAGLDIAINTNAEGNTPILQEADFFAAFSNNNEFNNYPTLSYTYHSIYYNGSNVGDLKIVPVRSSEYGIILVLCNISSHKAWAATDVNTGDLNTWYITTPISNNAGVVEIDVIHSTIPTGTNILLLQVFGDGVKWTKPNDTSTKTVNGMSLQGKGNVLITPNNSLYSATGNINSPIITDSTSYDDIDVIINHGFVPVFEDENGYYFHLWKHDTESLESTYEFANWIEDNNSITFKVYSIADAADSTWNSRTMSLT